MSERRAEPRGAEPELELALRGALAGRRPGPTPAGLRAAVEAVPTEHPPEPWWLPLLGWAPAAAVATLLVAASAVLLSTLNGTPLPPGSGAGPGDDPIPPGAGFTGTWLGTIIIWVTPAAMAVVALWATMLWIVSRLRGGPGAADVLRSPTTRTFVRIGAIVAPLLVVLANWHPLVLGSSYGPGHEFTDITRDGVTEQTQIGLEDEAPAYEFALDPGSSFHAFLTVRNDSILPVRLIGANLGLSTDGVGADWYPVGLGTTRDPNVFDAGLDNIAPFHPVWLLPGQEIVVVMRFRTGDCADPAGTVREDPSSLGTPFVWELLGWRNEDVVWWPYEIRVPSVSDWSRC